MEFAVRDIMRFLLATQNGVLSIFGTSSNMRLKVPVILPFSVDVRQVMEQVNILFIIQNFKCYSFAVLVPCNIMAAID